MRNLLFAVCIATVACNPSGKGETAAPAPAASPAISDTVETGAGAIPSPSVTTPIEPAPKSKTGYVASENRLYPIDEASKDPTLIAFRNRLLADVRNHDEAAVLQIVDPKIRVSFGDDNGVQAFTKQWKLDQKDSPFWTVMERILTLGGSFQKQPDSPRRFVAPYIYSDWPESVDAFEYLAVVGSDVAMRSSATVSSPSIATLDHDLVMIASDDPVRNGKRGTSWRKVVTADKKTGWVAADDLYSPVGYRAFFEKTPDGWVLSTLVAGD